MFKKLLTLLFLSVFISLIIFAAFLYERKNSYSNFYAGSRLARNKTKTRFWKIKDTLEDTEITSKSFVIGTNFWIETDTDEQVKINPITVLPVKTLEQCPESAPELVGPLLVEFNTKRNLDDIRNERGDSLQEGGRYKPPDCISQQKVAIIIPFRNRHEHLVHWLYYLHPILMRQQLDYGVYVINQDGDGVFNRAKLMNAGYVEALKEYDYECFVFSDIDLVPLDDRNLYKCFDSPRHLAVAMDKFNFNLPYNTYFGGVSSLFKQQFLKINGFPNTYWGWGGEDDDVYKRIIFRGMQISRPDLMTGRYKMIKHERDAHNEPNPNNPFKLHQVQRNMNTDGLNSLSYTVKEVVKDKLYTFITVDIQAPAS